MEIFLPVEPVFGLVLSGALGFGFDVADFC